MAKHPTLTTQDALQAAERYCAQAETYEDLTLQKFADFLGVGWQVVYRWLPASYWKQLQRVWVRNRLEQAMDTTAADHRIQENFTLEKFAQDAKVPLTVIPASFSEDEWQAIEATFRATGAGGRRADQRPLDGSTSYVLQAEKYLASTERYEEITYQHFARFVGVPEWTLRKRFPTYQWERLRDTWIENRVKQAIDAVFADSKTQIDFTRKKIAEYAAIPHAKVMRFLPESEFKDRRARLPNAQAYLISRVESYLAQTKDYKYVSIEHLAEALGINSSTLAQELPWETLRIQWTKNRIEEAMDVLCAQAKSISEFSLGRLSRYTGIPPGVIREQVPKEKWQTYREKLLSEFLGRARKAMDQLYAISKVREDFTLINIAKLAGVPEGSLPPLIGDEWRTRRAMLSTAKEKILATIQRFVNEGIPLKEFSQEHILEAADVNGHAGGKWFSDAHFKACRYLALRQRQEIADPPPGIDARIIPGGWIDLQSDMWDLRPAGGSVLRQEKLRNDFAEIGWPILQGELRSPDISLRTVESHYNGFLRGSAIFGQDVPDVRRATLETVQRAWLKFDGTQAIRSIARISLMLIFEALMRLAEEDKAIDATGVLRILTWLRDDIVIGHTRLGEEFLSESELNAVIQSCLADILAGIAYTDTNPDLLVAKLYPTAPNNAKAVVHWGTALMILIMAFTGLRRESILRLKITDWTEIHPDLYLLAWRHNKKVEENATVLPTLLTRHLQSYVQRTSQVRSALETDFVFFGSTPQGQWTVLSVDQFHQRLQEFVRRHRLERENIPLTLNSNVFRRTYTTRALYEGTNIAAVRSALGHRYLASTLRYFKFDRYEHPAQVGASLDEYGRKALTLWHAPLILDELNPDERATLLSVKVKREQDVGLCRHEHCLKTLQGSPPPCSLCEHLVTGKEFFSAWEAEHRWRTQKIEFLAGEPGSAMMLAQEKYLLELFEANFAFVRERFQ